MTEIMHSLYLGDLPGRYLTARCHRCKQTKHYSTDQMLLAAGNRQIRGLTTTIADAWGCPHLMKMGWEACQMTICVESKIESSGPEVRTLPRALKAWGANPADTATTLGELMDWHLLYGVCPCGHANYIDHKALRRRFGALATLGELQGRLKCRRNPVHQNMIFALGSMSR